MNLADQLLDGYHDHKAIPQNKRYDYAHVRARQIANDAVRKGELKPKGCEFKGCKVPPNRTVKHHLDYKTPLKVKWFCDLHHRQVHKEMGQKMPLEHCMNEIEQTRQILSEAGSSSAMEKVLKKYGWTQIKMKDGDRMASVFYKHSKFKGMIGASKRGASWQHTGGTRDSVDGPQDIELGYGYDAQSLETYLKGLKK